MISAESLVTVISISVFQKEEQDPADQIVLDAVYGVKYWQH